MMLAFAGSASASIIDDLGNTFGFDAGVFGPLLALGLIAAVCLLAASLGMRFDSPGALVLILLLVLGTVILGLLPSWVIVIIAVLCGLFIWHMISSPSSGAA